jgi:hypothetical protein
MTGFSKREGARVFAGWRLSKAGVEWRLSAEEAATGDGLGVCGCRRWRMDAPIPPSFQDGRIWGRITSHFVAG